MQLCRFDSFTPRGGGQRERRRTLRSPSPFSPTPLNGTTLAWFTACGGDITANRVAYTNIVCAIPVQVAHRHFDISFGCFVFGLRSLAFQKISLGWYRTFFIIGRMDCSFLRLRGVLLWSIVGITADRAIFSNFVGCKPISPMLPGAKISKKCVRAAETARKQVSNTV